MDALVAPHPESVDIVDAWLAYHGVDPSMAVSRSGTGDWISLTIPVQLAEEMLGNKYNVYKHKTTSETIVRTLSYSLPDVLHGHIDVVTPTTYFGTMKTMRATSFLQPEIKPLAEVQDLSSLIPAAVPSSCARTITPACLIALYNTTGYVPKATTSNSLGIAGYLDEYAIHTDLQVQLSCDTNQARGLILMIDFPQEVPVRSRRDRLQSRFSEERWR